MGYVPPCFWFEDNFSFGVTNYTSNATGASILEHFTIESLTTSILLSIIIALIVIYLEIYFSA